MNQHTARAAAAPGIKYWQCSRCRASFLSQDAARRHTCAGGASIVAADTPTTATTGATAAVATKKPGGPA